MDPHKTLLIVEDKEGFRTVYQDLLAGVGYGVILAEDGEKGCALSREKRPDLVLLDLRLPKLDGFEVLRRIRSQADTKAIPVIVISVIGEPKDIQLAMDLGANDYLVKGFYTSRQILNKVKYFLT